MTVTHAVRASAACVLLPAAVVTGRSAAVLWGVDLVGGADGVEVTVPPPVAQYRVRVGGRSVARVDVAWPEQEVALEYDALWHSPVSSPRTGGASTV